MLNLIPFITYVFVTTFTPGPNNLLSMSNAMHSGYRKTLKFLAGIFSGFLVVMLLCGLLNFALLSLAPEVRTWLNILGAAYMVYLAIHIMLSKPDEGEQSTGRLNTFQAGFVLQFLNLKGILYGVTVFSNFIVPAYPEAWQAALFAPLLAVIAFLAISAWALGGNIFRKTLNRYYRAANIVIGLLLIYTAIASLVH
jgi:threonine/homoserine/homoserine lactone efflux protein